MTPTLFSASSTRDWALCKRLYFLRQLWEGTGLASAWPDENLLFGILIHELMPALWRDTVGATQVAAARTALQSALLTDPGWEPSLIQAAREAKAEEWGRLLEGQVWGIQRIVLPYLRERYELVVAEGDAVRWVDSAKSAGVLAKPDTLLYPRPEAVDALPGVGYLEWKTAASVGDAWHRQWLRNPQAWTGALATRASLGVPIEWFQVCGLVKGSKVADAVLGKRRSTPLAWAFRHSGATKVIEKWKCGDAWWRAEHTHALGWERVSTDLYPGGLRGWVTDLPQEVIAKQFTLTEPQPIEWDLAEEWLENQGDLIEASQLWGKAAALPPEVQREVLRTYFPRSLEKCEAGGFAGKRCGMYEVCHGVAAEAPLEYGFKRREEHHPLALRLKAVVESE